MYSVNCLLNLAVLQEQILDFEASQNSLRTALQLDPTNLRVRKLQERMTAITLALASGKLSLEQYKEMIESAETQKQNDGKL